jgi:phosphate transport system substrate-binding protein
VEKLRGEISFMSARRNVLSMINRHAFGWMLGCAFCAGCFKAADVPNKTINIEGSSTVFPISQAIANEFEALHPNLHVAVAGNGTSSGFKKLISREADVCDASRPIAEKEVQLCQENGVEFLELKIAIDGLTVVVNKDNDWVDTLTVAQLKQLWDEGSTVKKWNEINPSWPDQPIKLFGPGTDSGTFDYFTEAVNGKTGRSRGDYGTSENDNILVDGVVGDKYALGYFGFAYYVNSSDRLKAVKIAVDDMADAVAPSKETVEDGSYKPLSRPLYIYINREALQRPEIAAFAEYYLSDAGQAIVEKRKYVRLNTAALSEMRERLSQAIGGK